MRGAVRLYQIRSSSRASASLSLKLVALPKPIGPTASRPGRFRYDVSVQQLRGNSDDLEPHTRARSSFTRSPPKWDRGLIILHLDNTGLDKTLGKNAGGTSCPATACSPQEYLISGLNSLSTLIYKPSDPFRCKIQISVDIETIRISLKNPRCHVSPFSIHIPARPVETLYGRF